MSDRCAVTEDTNQFLEDQMLEEEDLMSTRFERASTRTMKMKVMERISRPSTLEFCTLMGATEYIDSMLEAGYACRRVFEDGKFSVTVFEVN